MADLTSGASAKIQLDPGQSLRVEAEGGTTNVTSLYGAPAGTTAVTGSTTFGPYSVPAVLRVVCASGACSYATVRDEPPANALTAAQVAGLQGVVSGDRILDNMGAIVGPTAGDDAADGYSAGSLWFDTLRRVMWVCLDAGTSGNAIWRQVTANPHGAATGLNWPLMSSLTATAAAYPHGTGAYAAIPFVPHTDLTVGSLALHLVSAGTSANIKIAIYAAQIGAGATACRPIGAPLAASNTSRATGTTSNTLVTDALGAAVKLGNGIPYFACVQADSTTPTFKSLASTDCQIERVLGRAGRGNTCLTNLKLTGVTFSDAWPTLTGAESWAEDASNGIPMVYGVN